MSDDEAVPDENTSEVRCLLIIGSARRLLICLRFADHCSSLGAPSSMEAYVWLSGGLCLVYSEGAEVAIEGL